MKKWVAIFLSLVLAVCWLIPGGLAEGSEAAGDNETETAAPRGKVVVLATGGTIAGVGDPGKVTGYKLDSGDPALGRA